MSIIFCDKHSVKWDSDKLDECPKCENEPEEKKEKEECQPSK